MFSPMDFFDFSDWEHPELFSDVEQIWEVLPKIKPYLLSRAVSNLEGLPLEGSFLPRMVVIYQGSDFGEGNLHYSRRGH